MGDKQLICNSAIANMSYCTVCYSVFSNIYSLLKGYNMQSMSWIDSRHVYTACTSASAHGCILSVLDLYAMVPNDRSLAMLAVVCHS